MSRFGCGLIDNNTPRRNYPDDPEDCDAYWIMITIGVILLLSCLK